MSRKKALDQLVAILKQDDILYTTVEKVLYPHDKNRLWKDLMLLEDPEKKQRYKGAPTEIQESGGRLYIGWLDAWDFGTLDCHLSQYSISDIL